MNNNCEGHDFTYSDVALESGSLACGGLLLHRHDFHYFILQSRTNKGVDNLILLNGEGEQENLFNGLNLSIFDKTSKFGHRNPFLLVSLFTTTATPSSSSSTTTLSVSASEVMLISTWQIRFFGEIESTLFHGHGQILPVLFHLLLRLPCCKNRSCFVAKQE
jgi:hypothetical protein